MLLILCQTFCRAVRLHIYLIALVTHRPDSTSRFPRRLQEHPLLKQSNLLLKIISLIVKMGNLVVNLVVSLKYLCVEFLELLIGFAGIDHIVHNLLLNWIQDRVHFGEYLFDKPGLPLFDFLHLLGLFLEFAHPIGKFFLFLFMEDLGLHHGHLPPPPVLRLPLPILDLPLPPIDPLLRDAIDHVLLTLGNHLNHRVER